MLRWGRVDCAGRDRAGRAGLGGIGLAWLGRGGAGDGRGCLPRNADSWLPLFFFVLSLSFLRVVGGGDEGAM